MAGPYPATATSRQVQAPNGRSDDQYYVPDEPQNRADEFFSSRIVCKRAADDPRGAIWMSCGE